MDYAELIIMFIKNYMLRINIFIALRKISHGAIINSNYLKYSNLLKIQIQRFQVNFIKRMCLLLSENTCSARRSAMSSHQQRFLFLNYSGHKVNIEILWPNFNMQTFHFTSLIVSLVYETNTELSHFRSSLFCNYAF